MFATWLPASCATLSILPVNAPQHLGKYNGSFFGRSFNSASIQLPIYKCECNHTINQIVVVWFIRFAIGRDDPVKRVFTILFIAIFGSWKLFGSWHFSFQVFYFNKKQLKLQLLIDLVECVCTTIIVCLSSCSWPTTLNRK